MEMIKSERKSKLQLIGEIAQANNKNLELIEELNDREDEIERLNNIIEIKNKRIQQLMNRTRSARIRKAIEYIETHELYEQDYDYDYEENLTEYPPDDTKAKQDLLEILKGSDKK